MSRDPEVLAESAALRQAILSYRTLEALHAAPEWPELRERLARLLARTRRYAPAAPPALPRDPARIRAVQWNIEHGNWYEQVEAALRHHPDLGDADLLLFNEIDLGMARAGNRDVAGDLAAALGFHGAWAPLFLESTTGRDDDARMAGDRENQESLFGLAVLSRWPIGAVRLVELPSPQAIQFDLERMFGRHVGLVAEIERPGAPFVAVSVHLEVHRTRAHRARQVHALLQALRDERRPILLAGDFNSHTFDRGLWHSPLTGASALLLSPGPALERRLLHPDHGPHAETLFGELRREGFEWKPFVDYAPTLQLRLDRLDEGRAVLGTLGTVLGPVFRWAERRARLRLDWFAGRGWGAGGGRTVHGLDGPGRASDH
ncbi:MAG: hypothetical protein A2W00_06170, partial [Candidatus Eisenbacteria bacterium RBG_16_71_46]